jgi:hypothetical protein
MSLQPREDDGSVRVAVRWGLLLAMAGTVGFRLPRVVHELSAWRGASRMADAAGAETWRRMLMADGAGIAVVLAIGLAAFYFLRPRTERRA